MIEITGIIAGTAFAFLVVVIVIEIINYYGIHRRK